MKPNRVSRMAEVKLGKPKAIKSALEGERRRALKGTVPLRTVWKRDLNMLMASSHPGSSMTGLRNREFTLTLNYLFPVLCPYSGAMKLSYVVSSFLRLSKAICTQVHVHDNPSLKSRLSSFGQYYFYKVCACV